MAAVQPHTIRTAVQARVLASVSGSVVSEEPYELIRSPGRSPRHLEYAVGIPSTEPLADGRQRASTGCHARTAVQVVFAWQLKSKDRPSSIADAGAIEASIRNALVAAGWTDDFGLTWTTATRASGADGWIWTEQSFIATHVLPLQ